MKKKAPLFLGTLLATAVDLRTRQEATALEAILKRHTQELELHVRSCEVWHALGGHSVSVSYKGHAFSVIPLGPTLEVKRIFSATDARLVDELTLLEVLQHLLQTFAVQEDIKFEGMAQ
jgi:hypothetical protein